MKHLYVQCLLSPPLFHVYVFLFLPFDLMFVPHIYITNAQILLIPIFVDNDELKLFLILFLILLKADLMAVEQYFKIYLPLIYSFVSQFLYNIVTVKYTYLISCHHMFFLISLYNIIYF